MTLSPQDLHGLMAMMPAFATADAADIRAKNTVDVDNLRAGVDRMIHRGLDGPLAADRAAERDPAG